MYTLIIIMILHNPTVEQGEHLAHSFQSDTYLSNLNNSTNHNVLTFTTVPIHDSWEALTENNAHIDL